MAHEEELRGYHDIGGMRDDEVDLKDRPMEMWEKRVHAMVTVLVSKKLLRMDEYRRGVESLGRDVYEKESYYARWCGSVAHIMIQKGIITIDELGRKLAEIEARKKREES